MNSEAAETDYVVRQLGLFSLVRGDRFGSTLARFAINAPLTTTLIAAASGLSAAVVAYTEGTLVNPDLVLDLAHDLGWWNQFVFAFATLFYIAGAYFGAYPHTLRQLVDDGVLLATEAQWKNVRKLADLLLASYATVALPYVCGGAAAVLSLYVIQSPGAWFDVGSYRAGWLVPVHAFLLYYLLTFLALRLYFAYEILKMLFSFKVNIQPLHPDGCGGLESLRRQSAKLYIALLMFGLIATLAVISNAINYGLELLDGYNLIFLACYVLIISIAFFLPLYATSGSMRQAQLQLLQSINNRSQDLRDRIDDTQANANSDADLQALESLKATARAMQVWPFNTSALIRFIAIVSTPFLLIALYSVLA